MPIAAIEALIEVLVLSHESTVAGTLSVLKEQSDFLKARVPNSISLSAGADLFQQYMISSLKNAGSSGAGSIEEVRQHLLSNGRLFADRAKAGRDRIAEIGTRFIRDGQTVLTHGGSRVIGALLSKVADTRAHGEIVRFRIIYVMNGARTEESRAIISNLRAKGIPVATVPEGAVGYCMDQVDVVFVGAEGVVENGGIISRLGTYQVGVLAKTAGKPLYVAAESHKFLRLYPLGQYDLPIKQNIVDFKTTDDDILKEKEKKFADITPSKDGMTGYFDPPAQSPHIGFDEAVDFTPPTLIAAIITESGVLTPSAVSEELLNVYN